jgi:hypothetical protein
MGRTIRQEKVAVLRESYFKITGNVTEAMILNQMIYWAQRISDYDRFLSEENTRRKEEGKDCVNLAFGWIHKTAAELKGEIMSDASLKTIARKLDDLVEKGFLDRRNNPEHAYDRTYQYRVNLLKIYDEVNACGYQLEGFKVDFSSDDNSNDSDKKVSDSSSHEADNSNGHTDSSNCQAVPSICHSDKWNCHGDEAIPEITTETTSETTSSSYSPAENKTSKQKQNDDDDYTKGEVSEILKSIGIAKLQHKDMIHPISALISELILTGKVGQKRYKQAEIKKSLSQLKPSDIDVVIDRYTVTAAKGEIRNTDNYIKSCLISAGKAEELAKLAKKTGSDGIHCGNPSFDVDEYVKLSILNLQSKEQ